MTVQRTGASRYAQRQIERHRRLVPVADLTVRQIMKKSKTATKIGLGCLLVIIIALPLAYFSLPRMLSSVTGEPYFDNARDRAKLQRIAEQYDPVIIALGKHRAAHGIFPEDLADLDASIEGIQRAKSILAEQSRTVYYHVTEGEFMFHIKLNWDGGLNYQSESGHWRYEPGNGDSDWPILPSDTK